MVSEDHCCLLPAAVGNYVTTCIASSLLFFIKDSQLLLRGKHAVAGEPTKKLKPKTIYGKRIVGVALRSRLGHGSRSSACLPACLPRPTTGAVSINIQAKSALGLELAWEVISYYC